MKKVKIYVFFTVAIAWLTSFYACNAPSKISSQNIADIYRSDQHTIHPQFGLVHINDSVSQLFFKIDESELLYERRNPSDSFMACVKIYARVTVSYESPLILDSNATVLNFRSSTNNKKEFAVGSMPLRLDRGGHYLVTIITSDLNNKRREITYLEADKSSFLGDQNFLVRDASNGHILFTKYLDTCASIAISCYHPTNKLFVRYYKNNFPIATPPFTLNENESPRITPDSSFVLYPRGNIYYITLKSKGAYHFVCDSTDFRGLTVFRFEEHFPNIAEAYQLVSPLRYISTNEEFEKLTSSTNPKKNVDDFWLAASSDSKDKAKQLIHNFYNRIQDANRYFTSYLEGWKTDRGMIYIIFGAPNSIFRTSGSEVWTYGEDHSYLILTFTFIKLENPFTDNDYGLLRSANYRNLWYNGVDSWREGRVY